MGFFGDIWDGIKSAGRGILNIGSKIGRGILDAGNWVRDKVNTGVNFARKLPFVGGLVDRAINAPVFDGVSLGDIAGVADNALDVGNTAAQFIDAANKGDWDRAVKEGSVAYNAGKKTQEKFNEAANKRRQILAGRS